MTSLVSSPEAFELDSKAGSPVTLYPLIGRVLELYQIFARLVIHLPTPKICDCRIAGRWNPHLARILPDAHRSRSVPEA